MTPDRARLLFTAGRVAVLASTGSDGAAHLVPITFAVTGDTVLTAVDGKPKRSTRLRRLANLAARPQATLLVQHWSEDWSQLWWVRADGLAEITEDPPRVEAALTLLAAKYQQYQDVPIGPPVISIQVRRWAGWAAGPGPVSGD